ncbi:hypothetical protein ACJRO7_033407 [Eucalyptus globulus]|uniref:Retrotransposon gag domain-containing protein n=1 Tax=Eucalyptus globulus TaxID=34317 RepID=A0ABD3JZ90_EUCGL
MSDPKQRAPQRRAIIALTGVEERASTQVGVRERAPRRASARGKAPVQAGARGKAPVNPRVDGILQALETLGNMVGQQAQNQADVANAAAIAAPAEVPPGNGNGERLMHKLVEQFLKLKPPKFTGASDLEVATLWIRELEKAFALLRCSEKDKVILAVYRLQGNASTWWEATKGRVFPKGTVPKWDAFIEAFYKKYFLDCAQERKMAKFQRLRQNQMSMDQYEAKFAKLSKYATRLIKDSVDKARRFKDGLKPEIKDPLVPLNLKDYDELYERA